MSGSERAHLGERRVHATSVAFLAGQSDATEAANTSYHQTYFRNTKRASVVMRIHPRQTVAGRTFSRITPSVVCGRESHHVREIGIQPFERAAVFNREAQNLFAGRS